MKLEEFLFGNNDIKMMQQKEKKTENYLSYILLKNFCKSGGENPFNYNLSKGPT